MDTGKDVIFKLLGNGNTCKAPKWSESIAVGSKAFIEDLKEKLKSRGKGRRVISHNDSFTLRESQEPCSTVFEHEKGRLRQKNTYIWKSFNDKTVV